MSEGGYPRSAPAEEYGTCIVVIGSICVSLLKPQRGVEQPDTTAAAAAAPTLRRHSAPREQRITIKNVIAIVIYCVHMKVPHCGVEITRIIVSIIFCQHLFMLSEMKLAVLFFFYTSAVEQLHIKARICVPLKP